MKFLIPGLLSIFLGAALAQTKALTPCSLVSKAEVQEAVGSPVTDGALNAHNKMVCDYKIGDTGSVLSVTLTDKAPADSGERTVAEFKKRNMKAAVVTGIGDSAYATSPGMGMQQLGVYKGSKHIIVTVLMFGSPEAKSKAVAEKVMRKALARM